MDLPSLMSAMRRAGCDKLFAKVLSPNDNSKNQVYLGGSIAALHMFPLRDVTSENGRRGPTFKGSLDFGWLQPSGAVVEAPSAQIILYAQYPEVRLSGFLVGCPAAPNKLMTQRLAGRVLFMGVAADGSITGYVASPRSAAAQEFYRTRWADEGGVLSSAVLRPSGDTDAAKTQLLKQLRRIHASGWIRSKQLDAAGNIRGCDAPQCGGLTLEAELGIAKNSRAAGDFSGWEIKSVSVTDFKKPLPAKPVTLLTPEPTGGAYRDLGIRDFVRKFGYADRQGRKDRINFGGTFFVGKRHPEHGFALSLDGFDSSSEKITNANGSLALVGRRGNIIASWSFRTILEHWTRKHGRAAYVPTKKHPAGATAYSYGSIVHLAEGTNYERFLTAVACGAVYYDPGIKLEQSRSATPICKRRSQFRIKANALNLLYDRMEAVCVSG
jgi:hypothetical protein